MTKPKPDFSGYVTKANLRCSDGRTIMPEAFQHMDGVQVPLVWQHGHDSPENVLGHAVLEARKDGVYGYGFFNDTTQGINAKKLVQHKDISQLSIFANKLVEKASKVFHGMIREVSLVMAGANPGAFIDNIAIEHSDGEREVLADAAIIFTGLSLEHEDMPGEKTEEEKVEHAEGDTVQEIYDSMSDDQRAVVHFMVGAALEAAANGDSAEHSDDNSGDTADNEGDNAQEGSTEMVHTNVFEKDKGGAGAGTKELEKHTLTHDDMKSILDRADTLGSLRAATEEYVIKHGIEDIEVLFPEARNLTATPEFDKRRTEWVAGVLSGTRKSPFSRVKTIIADLTQEQARAKGYIKGRLKKEEWFGVSKRTTTPATIYKKQKLDRDDIIDITDFDVVVWMKGEMRLMLEEELARAILLGDGRDPEDEDKIKDPMASSSGEGIRSILNEHELYAATVNVNLGDSNSSITEAIDAIIASFKFYKGTGSPTFYTTLETLTKMLLVRDTMGRRLYRNKAELADELGVSNIVTVEVMEDDAYAGLLGIIVNLTDYNIGADKGGETTLFDDFDLDYNQYKYLIETRLSGALVKIRSALIIKDVNSASKSLVDPITEPTFVEATGVVTIPTQTGVVYKNSDTSATLSAGAQSALAPGATLNVIATPDSTHYFESNVEDEWSFTRPE